MPIIVWGGFEGRFKAMSMVSSLAAVTKQDRGWLVSPTASFASLKGVLACKQRDCMD